MGAQAIALAPYLVLPAVLLALGLPQATAFTGFTAGLVLLVLAAHIAVGVLRLPFLCLGGLAAAGAAFVQALSGLAGLEPWAALAMVPALGLALGGAFGLVLRWLPGDGEETGTALLSLALLLPLAALPLAAGGTRGDGVAVEDAIVLVPLLSLLAVLARLFAGSRLAELAAAAAAGGLRAEAAGLDLAGWRITGLCLAAAIATTAGAVMLIGPAPAASASMEAWAALAVALFAIGRLGGARFGGCLLAALPLALLPRLTVTLSPAFGDLTLAMALAALLLQAVVRRDGSLALLARPARPRSAAPFAAARQEP
ncbi:MAG: hypothetical protein H6852_05270 [Geminicoccaceae bacterium]|jgi:hypothetical protein|nr:hypothetical protein [Geminicoccaceae bacterium]MCB9967032.1 hypothetical protein [Geminicoccaceae bacterium]HRY24210.1 hypothetical protein [Geminicoccaceae bacterium]